MERYGDVNSNGPILVLEQDPMIRSLLEQWLQEAGYAVIIEVREMSAKPVLVIADVPGPQAAEALLGPLRGYSAPILVLSARFRRGLAGSMEAAHDLGVTKVLPKPFTRRELLSAVRESLKGIS